MKMHKSIRQMTLAQLLTEFEEQEVEQRLYCSCCDFRYLFDHLLQRGSSNTVIQSGGNAHCRYNAVLRKFTVEQSFGDVLAGTARTRKAAQVDY